MRRAFTLIELLVVIGIIAILAALLLPAVYSAVVKGYNTGMAYELNQIASAIEAYKQDRGDYPPSFRDQQGFIRHLRKCYPKLNPERRNGPGPSRPGELAFFFQTEPDPAFGGERLIRTGNSLQPFVWKPGKQLDEGEALVFWLCLTSPDPQKPFTGNGKKAYYDFDDSRLTGPTADEDPDPADVAWNDPSPRATVEDGAGGYRPEYRSYQPKYAKDTAYILIDSRVYGLHVATNGPVAMAEDGEFGAVRPLFEWRVLDDPQFGSAGFNPAQYGLNPSTFQLHCAGQDGEFDASGVLPNLKLFPEGLNYTDADKDNLANFTEGRTLADHLP